MAELDYKGNKDMENSRGSRDELRWQEEDTQYVLGVAGELIKSLIMEYSIVSQSDARDCLGYNDPGDNNQPRNRLELAGFVEQEK